MPIFSTKKPLANILNKKYTSCWDNVCSAEINYIRHEAERKDCSYSEIAKRTEKNPRTVKKYVEMDDFSPKVKPKQKRPAPVMEPVKEIFDGWILEDFSLKKNY